MTKKINHFVLWSRIFGILKLFIIIIPIIIGIIYLPPLLKEVFAPYQDLLGGNPLGALFQGNEGVNVENIDINQVPPELRKLLDK